MGRRVVLIRALGLVGLVGLVGLAATSARAEPTIGMSLHGGDGFGVADRRLGTGVYGHGHVGDGWLIGGEVAGSLAGYTGGVGCGGGGEDGDAVVPSIAVSCLEPGVAAHAIFGVEAAQGRRGLLRLELGAGASTQFVVPGDRGHSRRQTYPSGLVRASFLTRVAKFLEADWSLGLALDERLFWSQDRVRAASVGILLEGRSR